MKRKNVAALVLGVSLMSAPAAMAGDAGGKCGAGKCGGTKKDVKETNTTTAKCGTGKCGSKK